MSRHVHSGDPLRSAGSRSRFVVRSGVSYGPAGADTLIVNLETGTAHRLNSTGALLWSEIINGATPGEVADRLHINLGITRDRLLVDTLGLCDELVAASLLIPSTP